MAGLPPPQFVYRQFLDDFSEVHDGDAVAHLGDHGDVVAYKDVGEIALAPEPGKQPQEVICHVDFAPYNHVFRERRWVGAIDYDLCYPGPRAWDLAYTAYRYVPLSPHTADAVADGEAGDRSRFTHAEQRRRLALFCEAYGPVDGEPVTAASVLARLPERLDAMADWCDQQSDPDRLRDGVMYRAHARWIEHGGLDDSLGA